MKIEYLRHTQIDKLRWDTAIRNSLNGLVYGYSWFLDAMAGHAWDALVVDDYKAVFPLVWKRKFGIPYLYQPFFTQQLGLFSTSEISMELMNACIEAIPKKFRYWNFHLNTENSFFTPDTAFVMRTTYCIDLQQHYTEIYDSYNADAKKNLRKIETLDYSISKVVAPEVAADVFFAAYGSHYKNSEALKPKIVACAHQALQYNMGFTRAVYGPGGELWCAGFFFKSNGTIHYAMAAPTEAGKHHGITHLLIDAVLKEFAGTPYVFDFEGSDIPSVAFFYAKFGAKARYYTQIINNRMPSWTRVFMKKGL